MAKLLCSCLRSFEAIIELHPMDAKLFNDFLIGELNWTGYLIKACLFLCMFVYVVEAFIILV